MKKSNHLAYYTSHLFYEDDIYELQNLKEDISEKNNLAESYSYKPIELKGNLLYLQSKLLLYIIST